MEQNKNSRWLTEREVAAITKISLSTLRKHRHFMTGIPFSKVGKSVRYSELDVAYFMESRKVQMR